VIAILIVDRFEGDWAVVEFEGGTFNIPKALFPQQLKEGDVVKIAIIVDEEATKDRKKRVEQLADELFEE
jgi:predicted DNA-binding antitoxin AbrB/MazE fold protein